MDILDVFISYKREDSNFAEELQSRIQFAGRTVGIDKSIPYGRLWREEINLRLDNAGLVVLIVSSLSMQSAYVTYEWCYSWFKYEKDLHLIQIEDCNKDEGMFGLLMDYRNAPIKCSKTPTESEWQTIINSIESRLNGWEELKNAGKTLTTRGMPHPAQEGAARKLGQVRDRFHVPFARRFLLEGLRVNMNGYGGVQRETIASLEQIGDASAIPGLVRFCSIEHEREITERAEALIKRLAEQNT